MLCLLPHWWNKFVSIITWKVYLGKYLEAIEMAVHPIHFSSEIVNFKIQIYSIFMRKHLYRACLYLQDSNTLTDLVSILTLWLEDIEETRILYC